MLISIEFFVIFQTYKQSADIYLMINLTILYDIMNIASAIEYPKIHLTYLKTFFLLSASLTWNTMYHTLRHTSYFVKFSTKRVKYPKIWPCGLRMAQKNIHAVPIIGEGQGVNLGGVFFPRGHEFGSVIYESKIHFFTFFGRAHYMM